MNNTQHIIVFLWLVPVLGFIVLPVMWSVFSILYRAVERTRLHDIRGYVDLNKPGVAGGRPVEHRERPRIRLEKGQACVDEEAGCCKALVADISRRGICLKNVPEKMSVASGPFRVIFRTREKDYTVKARPRWKKPSGRGYVVGAELDRIPRGWKELVAALSGSPAPHPA